MGGRDDNDKWRRVKGPKEGGKKNAEANKRRQKRRKTFMLRKITSSRGIYFYDSSVSPTHFCPRRVLMSVGEGGELAALTSCASELSATLFIKQLPPEALKGSNRMLSKQDTLKPSGGHVSHQAMRRPKLILPRRRWAPPSRSLRKSSARTSSVTPYLPPASAETHLSEGDSPPSVSERVLTNTSCRRTPAPRRLSVGKALKPPGFIPSW